MKKIFCLMMTAFLFLSLVSCDGGTVVTTPEPTLTPAPSLTPSAPSSPELSPSPDIVYPTYHLTILHTNDWHGVLDNVPYYATLAGEIRAETDNVLLLDAGDIFRRGPYESLFGEVEITIMNAMGYDALTFGNNDYPQSNKEMDELSRHPILQLAEFPVLSANVAVDDHVLEGFQTYTLRNIGGLDIAIIGVTSMKPHNRGYDISKKAVFTDPEVMVEQMLSETAPVSDIQIVLSHAGIVRDRMMRGVSAVIGGDDHRKFRKPVVIQDGDIQIPVVQAGGEESHAMGRLDLTFVQIDGAWVLHGFEGGLLSLDGVRPDPEIQRIIDSYQTELELAA